MAWAGRSADVRIARLPDTCALRRVIHYTILAIGAVVGLSTIGVDFRFWLNLQMVYDLDVQTDRLARRLPKEVEVLASAS